MTYRVEFSEAAKKSIKKLDRPIAVMLLGWIRKNLDACEDPRIHGKGLTANLSGKWRYRVGVYRILAFIDDGNGRIVLLLIGHRSEIYK